MAYQLADSVRAVVLAAGKSTRFKRKESKQLVTLCGKPMIMYPLQALLDLHIPITLVLGYQADEIRNTIEAAGLAGITVVYQKTNAGTADAVSASESTWNTHHVLILNGDMPLITSHDLKELYFNHLQQQATVSFVTAYTNEPTGYGRVVEENGLMRVVEEKDCNPEEKKVKRINAGAYLVETAFLRTALESIVQSKITGELYLPDIIYQASCQGRTVIAHTVPFETVRGINTLHELWQVEQGMRTQLVHHWLLQGVRFSNPNTVHIDTDVTIGSDAVIGAGVHLERGTVIGNNVIIEPYSIIRGSVIHDNACVRAHCVIEDSIVEEDTKIGPFARLRNQAVIKQGAEIGNFVEVKKSTVGVESKAKHLAYIGDAVIGKQVNVGAGAVTCNHNGIHKQTTHIEDRAYVGSNTTLIAPVRVCEGGYVAAGSTITHDVEADALAIARARQQNKLGYVSKMMARKREER